jgi:glycosyltransferase involved in cell wall biosynthesis
MGMPLVSVIAPACNEAVAIEAAVRGFLALDWPQLEVIVINDRSTDGTALVLQRLLAEADPRLRVLTIADLPNGWLGKNHANAQGAALAQGEWLLFTDADVQLQPPILAKAMAHAAAESFDHIAAAPEARLPGGVLSQFALYFALLFSVWARPWAARNPRSRAHVGIGAFNLVRRSVYDAAGGHAAVRLCPDDDLELGRCLKLVGGRQDFVFANGLAAVDWYGSWGEVRRGLMKNLFAGAGYSVPLVLVGAAAQLWLLAWPVPALLLTTGLTWWLNLGILLVLGVQGWLAAQFFGGRRYGGWLLPLFAVFGSYLMLRSMALALANGGIEWRGTFYSLAELRGFPRRRK